MGAERRVGEGEPAAAAPDEAPAPFWEAAVDSTDSLGAEPSKWGLQALEAAAVGQESGPALMRLAQALARLLALLPPRFGQFYLTHCSKHQDVAQHRGAEAAKLAEACLPFSKSSTLEKCALVRVPIAQQGKVRSTIIAYHIYYKSEPPGPTVVD